jgi:tRNA(adenine34) deaminase
MSNDEKWMEIALDEAEIAFREDEVPVGAVLVMNEKLIAKAHNQSITYNDPSAHAEIQLLRKAGKQLDNYRLTNTTMYITLEPCVMCLGAIMHARVSKIVYAAKDFKTGACGSCINLLNINCFNHKLEIRDGILKDKSKKLIQQFFQSKRSK